MLNLQQQTTAAGKAVSLAAVAMRKPALLFRTGREEVAAASQTGDIPAIIGNDRALYEGDLAAYFRTLFFNATNLDRPFHNLRHMLHVTWLCYQAAEFYRDRLTRREIRNLLIAAMFHDFDHPGRPHPKMDDPDDVNISIAIAGLRRYIGPEDRPFLPTIEALIEATHYPHTVSSDKLELAAQIIRDADLAQALCPAWIQQIVIGLARELREAPLKILKMQPAFLMGLSFQTDWARERFPAHLIAAKVTEAERLLALLAVDNP